MVKEGRLLEESIDLQTVWKKQSDAEETGADTVGFMIMVVCWPVEFML
jgi:hypothetical protein